MSRTSGPSPCTLIRDAPGGTTTSPGSSTNVPPSSVSTVNAGEAPVTTMASSPSNVPLSRSAPDVASVCTRITFCARTIEVSRRSKYWAAAMASPLSGRVAVASADRGSSFPYAMTSSSGVEVQQVGRVVADHAPQVLLRQAEVEQRRAHAQPRVHGLGVRGLPEVGRQHDVLGAEPLDPGHQLLRVPLLRALGVVHADLVLDVRPQVDQLAAQVRLGADHVVGVADDHARDPAFPGGGEQLADGGGVHVPAVDHGLLLLDLVEDLARRGLEHAFLVDDVDAFEGQRDGRGRERPALGVAVDVPAGGDRREPYDLAAHAQAHAYGVRVEPADGAVQRDAAVGLRRDAGEPALHGQEVHLGVVVVGLRDHGTHADPGTVLGGLDVVEPPGERTGSGVDVHVDQPVEDGGDGRTLAHKTTSFAM